MPPEDHSEALKLDHERRITDAQNSADNANNRITEVISLIRDFTKEMRDGNKNVADLVYEVKTLTSQIGLVVTATEKHEEDIAAIKSNMETKDTVLQLYKKIENSDAEYKKGQDVIMEKLRQQDRALEDHELEPAKQALAAQQQLKGWFIKGFGGVIFAVITAVVMILIFN